MESESIFSDRSRSRSRLKFVDSAALAPSICRSPPRAEPCVRCHAHLVRLELAEPVTQHRSISILIGQDHIREVIDRRSKTGTADPIKHGSRFGWILSGPSDSGEGDQPVISNFIREEKASDLPQDLWSLEKIVISSVGATIEEGLVRCDCKVETSRKLWSVCQTGGIRFVGLGTKE